MYSLKYSVHEQFLSTLRSGKLPELPRKFSAEEGSLSREEFLFLFESQILSRHLDFQARELKEKGLGYYTIGSCGHEGNAGVAYAFSKDDMAFLHYRSGAFFITRARLAGEEDFLSDLTLSLLASREDPTSGGRHKVFGSLSLNIPPQTSTIASHLPKAVGAALSVTRAKELGIKARLEKNSVVLASFGDASFNHASCQTALNAACWLSHNNYPLPLVFVCEDNGIGISTPSPSGWIESCLQARQEVKYIQADGLNLFDVLEKSCLASEYARRKRKPVFLHIKCIRLLGHAGSDIESLYRSEREVAGTEARDPLLFSASFALKEKFLTKGEVLSLYESLQDKVEKTVLKVSASSSLLQDARDVMKPFFMERNEKLPGSSFSEEERNSFIKKLKKKKEQPRNLAQSLNLALFDLMLDHENILLLGEDIGKKGGVYHVTNGLQKEFGQRRVFDTILDETMILGTAIGLAHNNFLPIPEIQFLAYLHNAEDQIRGEASTLSFFSEGQFQNPMVLRIPGLAYQKGFGGHFHNDNSLSVLRDIPSLIMVCPSRAEGAPALLRESVRLAWKKSCVVVFLEPIALYMTKDLYEDGDGLWLSFYSAEEREVLFGEVSVSSLGRELTLVSYANGYYLSLRAQKILEEKHQILTTVIDLRWLKPLPMKALMKELSLSNKVLIVDECRKTGSISEELMTRVYEEGRGEKEVHRITAEDSFIPLGAAAHHVLPSENQIVEKTLTVLRKKDLSQVLCNKVPVDEVPEVL